MMKFLSMTMTLKDLFNKAHIAIQQMLNLNMVRLIV